mgnify:CR=1 FL=1
MTEKEKEMMIRAIHDVLKEVPYERLLWLYRMALKWAEAKETTAE